MLTCCQQLAFGSARECLGAHAGERLECRPQMLSCVDAATLAAQPLTVKQMSARELESHTGT
jgi:hypothetical protein